MAWVPGFEHDVFVSYAHVDDQFVAPETLGWVSRFVNELKAFLPPRLGRAEGLSVWCDPRIRGSADVDREIVAAIESSAVFVCVLSTGWLASGYCARELAAFTAAVERQASGSPPAIQSRAVKLLLSNVAREDQPSPIDGQNGHRFFAVDPATSVDERFRRTEEKDADQRHWKALHAMTWDVAEILRALAEARGRSTADAPPLPARARSTAPRVFLAEVTDDMDERREELRASLAQKGLAVIPDAPLPLASPALDARLAADLPSCAVSVHLLGEHYGRRLTPGGPSLPHVQLDAAAQRGVHRIVWMDPSLRLRELKAGPQRDLVAVAEAGAELVQCRLEELKDLILSRAAPEQPPPQVTVDRGAMVYVAALPEDEPTAKRLATILADSHHDVVFAARTADAEAERHHERNLQACDAFVVLFGNSVLWARDQVIRARQLARQRRVSPHLVLSVVDAPPPVKKEDLGLEFKDLLLLGARDHWPPEHLQDLLHRLEACA